MSSLNKNNGFSSFSSNPPEGKNGAFIGQSENKQEVVSITYEEIGLFPRSFSRVLDRFLKQVFSDVENLVIQEYRFYRYLFLTTLKCLLILFFIPFFVNFLAKTYVVRPLTEYFWNTKQTEIFLNSYQQKRAFAELKEFEEKTYFESLIFPKSVFISNFSNPPIFPSPPKWPLLHDEDHEPSSPLQEEALNFKEYSSLYKGDSKFVPVGLEAQALQAAPPPATVAIAFDALKAGPPTSQGAKAKSKVQGALLNKRLPSQGTLSPPYEEEEGKRASFSFKKLSASKEEGEALLVSLDGTAKGTKDYSLPVVPYTEASSLPLKTKNSSKTVFSLLRKDFSSALSRDGDVSQEAIRKHSQYKKEMQQREDALALTSNPNPFNKSGSKEYIAPTYLDKESKALLPLYPNQKATTPLRMDSIQRPFPFLFERPLLLPVTVKQQGTEPFSSKSNTNPVLPLLLPLDRQGWSSIPFERNLSEPSEEQKPYVMNPPSLQYQTAHSLNLKENLKVNFKNEGLDYSKGTFTKEENEVIQTQRSDNSLKKKIQPSIGLGLQANEVPINSKGLEGQTALGTQTPYNMKSSLFVYQTQEADKNIQQRYQEKTIELAQRYNDQSIEAITNLFADLISLLTLFYLLYALEIQINITKSFLLEVFFGLDDSKKSLLILLITDLLVGYHSSNLWELFFEFLFHHYGLPESQTGIFLLVATLPVLLDVLFKYLIFRHLNRSSPATVATYHAMIE